MKKAKIATGMTASFPAGRERIAIVYRKVERIYAMRTTVDRDPFNFELSLVLEGFAEGSDARDGMVLMIRRES